MRKIPALREPKKRPKIAIPKPLPEETLFPHPVPPSIYQLKKLGREWTQAEIIEIIKLQHFLQQKSIGVRTRDFKKLWERAGGKCMLTGYPFGMLEVFDVGIDVVRAGGKRDVDNYRLVLLPLAYSRTRCAQYSLKIDNLPPEFVGKPLTRAIFLSLAEAIENHPLSRNYAVTAKFDPNHFGEYAMIVGGAIFPVGRWYRKEERSGRAGNRREIISAILNQDRCEIRVPVRSFDSNYKFQYKTHTFSLANPNCDFAAEFAKLYQESFKASLAMEAMEVLEKWVY